MPLYKTLLIVAMQVEAIIIITLIAICFVIFVFYLYRTTRGAINGTSSVLQDKRYADLEFQFQELQSAYNVVETQVAQLQTENNRLNAEIEKIKMTAEESDILKSKFIANLSHEIRTPMNGIMGFVQLLKYEEDRERIDYYINIIHNSGFLLVSLIDDIVDLSKIDAGQLSIINGECDVDSLLFGLYSFFNDIKFRQEKEHISIRLLNLNADDEATAIYTDEHRLKQILTNLISNAMKFTDSGSVDFGYEIQEEEQTIKFFVRDTGIGIPESKRQIIYDKFRQGYEGSTRRYSGTGIGLHIAKCLVEMLGGSIWYESEVGVGTIFFFTIPYNPVAHSITQVETISSDEEYYNWEGKRILVAEDVETNYRYIRAILDSTKATVVWASNGKMAVDKVLKGGNFDVVLMDMHMPVMDGYEATRLIRESNDSTPIIAQTAYVQNYDSAKCIEFGCNDFIPKPINALHLKMKMENYINV